MAAYAERCGVVNGDGTWTLPSWQEIDRGLREIAKRRCTLDVEEAALVRLAVRAAVWKQVGHVSLSAYLEDVFGYAPPIAGERVRVALALEDLPDLTEALATGEQSYSAVRELTRVATPETELEWRDAARGMKLREIEALVAGHRRGDRPTDLPDPDLKPRTIQFKIRAATYARLRQVRQVLADEHGGSLDDDALIEAMCAAVLEGKSEEDGSQGRAKYQVMTTICEQCKQGWQDGGGATVAVDDTAVARAECDAQRIGSDREPGDAVQDVAPKIRRHVWRRDHGRCQVPGCRSARHLELHHIVPREHGGSHEAVNLVLLCNGHHDALHRGLLQITGQVPDLRFQGPCVASREQGQPELGASAPGGMPASVVKRHGPAPGKVVTPVVVLEPDGSATERMNRFGRLIMETEAIQGLAQLGFSKAVSRAAVEHAAGELAENGSLEDLIRAALALTRSSA